MRRTKRRLTNMLRVKGHAVDATRMYGADWVRGALPVAWALGAGGFIVAGGTSNFKAASYAALVETFAHTNLIGGALILGGVMGFIGMWADWRWLSKTSAIVCALWHGLMFGYTFPANLGAFGNSNLVSLFSLLVCLLYVVQLIEIWPTPTDKAISR